MTKNDNKNGSFAIELNAKDNIGVTLDFYKRVFLKEIKTNYPKLKIDGLDYPPVLSGIDEAGANNLITVGTSDKHDISWIRRPGFAAERGLKPVYDIIKDWNTIKAKLKEFYNNKYGYNLSNGINVRVHENFVKVGLKYVPIERDSNGDIYAVINNGSVSEIDALINSLSA